MSYPQRESHYAHKFVRRLTECGAAQELGPAACWLLTVIAHQEDALRYRRAVTYWNEQLCGLLGMSRAQVVRVRQRCVDLGWLHYEAGAKGRAGRYWVTIPDPDTVSNLNGIPEGSGEIPSGLRPDTVSNLNGIRAPFIPNPVPYVSSSLENKSKKSHPSHKHGAPDVMDVALSRSGRPSKMHVDPSELRSLARGDERFRDAVAARLVPDTDHGRLLWLTLWQYVGRQETVDNPGGLLRHLATSGRWEGSEEDEAVALDYLRQPGGEHSEHARRLVDAWREDDPGKQGPRPLSREELQQLNYNPYQRYD